MVFMVVVGAVFPSLSASVTPHTCCRRRGDGDALRHLAPAAAVEGDGDALRHVSSGRPAPCQ